MCLDVGTRGGFQAVQKHLAVAVNHDAFGRLAVAAGAADLLQVLF